MVCFLFVNNRLPLVSYKAQYSVLYCSASILNLWWSHILTRVLVVFILVEYRWHSTYSLLPSLRHHSDLSMSVRHLIMDGIISFNPNWITVYPRVIQAHVRVTISVDISQMQDGACIMTCFLFCYFSLFSLFYDCFQSTTDTISYPMTAAKCHF